MKKLLHSNAKVSFIWGGNWTINPPLTSNNNNIIHLFVFEVPSVTTLTVTSEKPLIYKIPEIK